MLFSIVTPTFRGMPWLKLCVASVADQDVEHEHIVQDACSDDGTGEWLATVPGVSALIEKDRGMYDAVNRGLRRARGDFLAYLNCDEQYTPGALGKVARYFEDHPHVDMVFADTVVVDGEGRYLCERWALTPQKFHTLVSFNLSFLTCATFFRRRVIEELDLYFNPDLKTVGDSEWALRCLSKHVRMGVLRAVTSIFTETGDNLSRKENALRERGELFASAPAWARALHPLIVAHFRWRRWRSGAYSPVPREYAIYTLDSLGRRKRFAVQEPSYRWERTAVP